MSGLGDDHAQRGKDQRQVTQGREQRVDEGIDDLPLVLHHEDGAGEADQEGRERHGAEAQRERLAVPATPSPPTRAAALPIKKNEADIWSKSNPSY